MKIEGPLKADELRVGRIIIDHLKNPAEVSALAGLIDSKSAQTVSWTKAEGMWSDETREAVNVLREAMERDICKALFGQGVTSGAVRDEKGLTLGGLGEHLKGDDAVPSI